MLPEEYVHTMRRTMLDACPVSPYREVSRIVTEDLGSPPEELFAAFDHVPIASASLAQVLSKLGPGSAIFKPLEVAIVALYRNLFAGKALLIIGLGSMDWLHSQSSSLCFYAA